jgi:hypothetical protein
MKEHGILMQGESVLGILEGRKSHTRRVIKGKWLPLVEEVLRVNGKWVFDTLDYELTTPYGQPGDKLWVRETWGIDPNDLGFPEDQWKNFVVYKSDWINHPEWFTRPHKPKDKYHWGWKPSIFMPRWASRITLEIVNVRVERLQDISEADIIAEGCPTEYLLGRSWYKPLWEEINAKRGYGWDTNPYVWVIEFRVLK